MYLCGQSDVFYTAWLFQWRIGRKFAWASSHLGDLGLICIRQIFIWNGEMKTAA